MEKDIAHRYAKAFFNLGQNREQLDIWKNDLDRLLEVQKNVPELETFLINPQISTSDKASLLKRIVSDDLIIGFILLLLENKRYKHLIAIVREFHRLMDLQFGIVEVKLVTAHPVDTTIKQTLKEKLEAVYDHQVKVNERIDPSIIGGAMVLMGNKLLDSSLKTRLNELKLHLLRGLEI